MNHEEPQLDCSYVVCTIASHFWGHKGPGLRPSKLSVTLESAQGLH